MIGAWLQINLIHVFPGLAFGGIYRLKFSVLVPEVLACTVLKTVSFVPVKFPSPFKSTKAANYNFTFAVLVPVKLIG